jgi:hypothetical protein
MTERRMLLRGVLKEELLSVGGILPGEITIKKRKNKLLNHYAELLLQPYFLEILPRSGGSSVVREALEKADALLEVALESSENVIPHTIENVLEVGSQLVAYGVIRDYQLARILERRGYLRVVNLGGSAKGVIEVRLGKKNGDDSPNPFEES